MKDLLDKLSSYNIFNYLLPGVLFAGMSKSVAGHDLVQENILVGVFVYYFIGMIISRIGSLIIEPLLKKMGVVHFAEYEDFVKASKKDEKIELLSEANNTYRTIVSMAVLLLLLRAYISSESYFGWAGTTSIYVLCGVLILVFVFAHRKQTNYIRRRVEIATCSGETKEEFQ